MSLKVLISSGEGEAFFPLLEEVPGVEIKRCPPAEALQNVEDVEVFYGHPSVPLIQAAPRLKWIQSPSAGVEFVANIPELVTSDVILTNTRGAHGLSIGEHTIALLLAMTRHIPESIEQNSRKHWERGKIYRSAREIHGLTMGIIGFGAIGRGIAQRAKGFDMELLAVDAFVTDGQGWLDEVWPVSRLSELLRQADVVVVSAPLTAETTNMIGAEQFALMKDDAYLVVVSRGGIVNEDALVDTLNSGKLAGVGLDVTVQEPLPQDSPLWDTPRLLMTPHLAGASAAKERRVVEIFKDNLVRYLDGDPLANVVDKAKGY